MVVGVCGYGYTGSGAVVDLLKEYEENQVIDDIEFTIAYTPDGLAMLDNCINNMISRFGSDVAISRFVDYIKRSNTSKSKIRVLSDNQYYSLSMNYIKDITQVSWKGFWGYDFIYGSYLKRKVLNRIARRLLLLNDKWFKRNLDIYPNRKMYLSISEETFDKRTKKYVMDLVESIGGDEKKINVLNQPFMANNPALSFKYFEDPFAILVDRDPRDLYILAKHILLSKCRYIPTQNVEDFIRYYKALRKNRAEVQVDKKVLYVQFEDLIYEYDSTISKIEKFLNINRHNKKKQYFKPEVSAVNTQLYKRFGKEYDEEIRRIESELEEYLYSFDKYRAIQNGGEVF